MSEPCHIPTNFRVPKGHRHRFLLNYGPDTIAVLSGVPGKKRIFFQTYDKPGTAEEAALVHHCCMDWMAESIAHLRFLCTSK